MMFKVNRANGMWDINIISNVTKILIFKFNPYDLSNYSKKLFQFQCSFIEYILKSQK